MLLEHNKPVYKSLCETLEKYNKAVVVTFTGGGKSFIANEYLTEKKLCALVVCPKRVICHEWEKLNPNVTTMTYSAFSKTPMDELLHFEAVVLDEVHHCGSKVWGAKTKELMEKTSGLVIGLTADPVRWSDGGKNVAYTLFDGHIVRGNSLAEAIDKQIVRPFTYVCTVIGLKEMIQERVDRVQNADKMDSKLRTKAEHLIARLKMDEQAVESVQTVLKQHMPASPKGIVFVDDISAIDETLEMMANAFPGMPLFSIHTKQAQSENEAQMAAFKNAKSAAIVSVNMLGEGVHVDGVNFVVMLRRTQSPTVFFQQLGRGTAVGSETDPVIFDVVGNRHTLQLIESAQSEVLGLFQRDTTKRTGQFIISSYVEDALQVLQRIDELTSSMRPWAEEEIAILRQYYPTEGRTVYKRLPGRTPLACRTIAQKLGIAFVATTDWTDAEMDILFRFFPSEGQDVYKRLPNRSASACVHKAYDMGLRSLNGFSHWSSEEDAVITKYYPKEGQKVYKRLSGRTPAACVRRASVLGIGTGWTEEDEKILREYYPTEGGAVCKRLGKTKTSCQQRAQKLGLSYTRWTLEKDEIIRRYYPTEGPEVYKRISGETKNSCGHRAGTLGVKYIKGKEWTDEENEIFIRYYFSEEIKKLSERFPGVTLGMVKNHAKALGLNKRNSAGRWADEEIKILRKYYPIEGLNVCLRLKKRTKKAVVAQAIRLGL